MWINGPRCAGRSYEADGATAHEECSCHDLRRTVRSELSALRVPHNVAEAILAHRPPGIVGTYNLHEYEDEKAEALEAWAQSPVPAAPAKVVKLRGRRR
jgi:integrase